MRKLKNSFGVLTLSGVSGFQSAGEATTGEPSLSMSGVVSGNTVTVTLSLAMSGVIV